MRTLQALQALLTMQRFVAMLPSGDPPLSAAHWPLPRDNAPPLRKFALTNRPRPLFLP
jgi:hypothetical protein